MKKEAPSSKIQIPNKLQIPNTNQKILKFWSLVFVWSLVFGAWSLLSGCTGMGTLVKQLKGDPATVSVSLTTVYGNLKFIRTNPGTNTETTVTPDGTVTVKRP